MGRRIFLILFLLITNLLITNHYIYAFGPWSPWHRTLPIEGRITDATTGEPIEGGVRKFLLFRR